jgi:uncharacterized membrane protein YeaQ/YmgE (transglycosylase-associated protein family)
VLWNLISWLVVGAIAGWLAGYILKKDTSLSIMDILLGILGAVVGGWLSGLVMGTDIATFSVLGIVFAVIGALILAFGYEKLTGRSAQ